MARVAKVSNNKRRQINGLIDQAAQVMNQGRFDVCDQLCARIEALQPGNADVANIRGVMQVRVGKLAQAEQLFVQAINAAPRRAEFHDNLGKLYLHQKLFGDAAERYRTAMNFNPNDISAKLGYCSALVAMGQAAQALPMLEKLYLSRPKHADVLMSLFWAYEGLNRSDEALSSLDNLIELDAGHYEARFQRAQAYMRNGRMQEAESELREALNLRTDDPKAYAMLTEMKKFQSADDPDILAMHALYESSPHESPARVYLCFSLGKVHESLEQYDKAFSYFEEGNVLRNRHSGYNLDAELAHMQAIQTLYTPEVLQHCGDLADDRPIFIVGMPRSGSTLTEQILAAHPEVSSRGEWNAFEQVLFDYSDPDQPLTLEEMTSFSAQQWREVGQRYLDRLDDDRTSRRITDKTLVNFRMIGAIHCALPHAKIIHVRRHPLDNCLSVFRSNLRGGEFDFGHNLGQLGYTYRMYQQLMQHWRKLLPAGVMYEMDYESLVANQEGETRKLLAECDLPWNDTCLQFSKTKNIVHTASVAQVRREIYTDAVARWKHYEKQLEPLVKILGVTA